MALVASAAVAGSAAVTAYLNAKFHLRKDLEMLWKMKRAEKAYAHAIKEDRVSIWYLISNICRRYPQNQALWSRKSCYTFAEVYDRSVQYAQWFLDQSIQPGELVALYLHNSAEFMIIWFALLCIGAAPAFINYNLEGEGLLHCLSVCETKLILVDEDVNCQQRIKGSKEEITSRGTKIVVLTDDLRSSITSSPVILPSDEYRRGFSGEFLGTTGLPKGCAFTTSRLWLLGSQLEPAFNGKPGVDRWYSSMPLYHGTGSMASISQFIGGVSIAIGAKFSVSKFWPDVHDSKSTFFIYVGETARYLLNAPPHPLERDHNLRCAYGNGMRPDVWEKFRTRFNIPEVAEFFNSTEGLFALINWDRGPYQAACVGHHGLLFRKIFNDIYIPVQIDHETGDIWRDPQRGFAKRMPYEIGGEILVAVPSKKAFQGYWRAEAATDKKFCHNVFKKGDIYYRSGDALRRDPDGKWHFLDRLGDTFRWKSENVSTAEVSECLGKYPGIAEANIYGVIVPNHEGRAGCAALHIDPNHKGEIDLDDMLRYAHARLPRYAVPVFIRLVKESSHIHNHKQNKVPLRKEGVDPKAKGTEWADGKEDRILWRTPKAEMYVEFGQKEWEDLVNGKAKL